jgi:Maltose acetyltransferase.
MNLDEKFQYMATGKPYNDLDQLLVDARAKSTELTTKINNEDDEVKKEN